MQHLLGTLRLFQMSTLIRSSFLVFWLLYACGNEVPTLSEEELELPESAQVVQSPLKYTLTLPEELRPKEENESGDYVQYASVSKERYVEIHTIDKASGEGAATMDLAHFADARLIPFRANSTILKHMKLREQSINALSTITTAFDVKRAGSVDTWSYWMAFIEGKEHYYDIRIWTRSDRKAYFEQTANAIIYSFKEQ